MAVLSENDDSLIRTEVQLLHHNIDFPAAYLAVQYLFFHIRKSLDSIRDHTIEALFSVLRSDRHDSQKQAFFLYKEASDALIHISVDIRRPFSFSVLSRLQDLLVSTRGKKHRAVSEALGSLPLNIAGPDMTKKSSHGFLFHALSFMSCSPGHPGFRSLPVAGKDADISVN